MKKTYQMVSKGCPPRPGFPVKDLVALLRSLPRLEDDAVQMVVDLKMICEKEKMPWSSWG